MAFASNNFIPGSSMANSSAGRMFSYRSGTDTLAAIKAASYFDEAAVTTGGLGLKSGDFIIVDASDGYSILAINVDGAGVVTTVAANDFV